MTKYEQDIKEAALSSPSFDEYNSIEIGDFYGYDPAGVLQDIRELREAMEADKKSN